MRERWPEDTIVTVILNCRQKVPSTAEVMKHYGADGTVRVRLCKPNKKGDRHVVDVRWERVDLWPQDTNSI